MQQGALARARATDYRDLLTLGNFKVDSAQYIDLQRAFHKPLVQAMSTQNQLAGLIHNAVPPPAPCARRARLGTGLQATITVARCRQSWRHLTSVNQTAYR